MNQLINVLETATQNENGGLGYTTVGSNIVNFVTNASVLEEKWVMRKKQDYVYNLFVEALKEDPIKALASLLYSRSILNGAGQRFYFQYIITKLLIQHPKIIDLLTIAIERGWAYWGDFFSIFEIVLEKQLPVRKDFIKVVAEKLADPTETLFRKWFPRSGRVWQYTWKTLGIKPKELRKNLVAAQTVESLLGAGKVSAIKYSQVPAKSMVRNSERFQKLDHERYNSFIQDVIQGKATIKAATIFPHEILYSKRTADEKEAQWKNMPNFIKNEATFLPVLDCSWSMHGLPMHICFSLGIYLSEHNKSVFKDRVLLFSRNAHWVHLEGSLEEKLWTLSSHAEVANTDFNAVFSLILTTSVANRLNQNDLPSHLICITDGQFDKMSDNNDMTVFAKYRDLFRQHGYVLPKVVFWNLRATGVFPERLQEGVMFVGGSSPQAIKMVLEDQSPEMAVDMALKPFIPVAEQIAQLL